MNGFAKSALAVVCMAGTVGSIGCTGGGERYRNLVDPCQKERYASVARQEVISAFTPQVQNGHILDQTIFNAHFEQGTDKLTPGGMDKLDQLVQRRPQPDPRIFLATARDTSYNPDKADDFADTRRDLDAKRNIAIQKYLTAQTAGRPMAFEVLVHDPALPGIAGISARNALLSQRNNYSGSLGGAGGGGAGAQQGGGQQGGGQQGGGQQGGGQQGGGQQGGGQQGGGQIR